MAKPYTEKKITINLSKVFNKPVTKRAKSAVFLVRSKVRKETRAEDVLLSNKVNEALWAKGMKSSPRKLSVKVINDKGAANVYLPDEKVELKKEDKKKEKGLKAKVEEVANKGKETIKEPVKDSKKEDEKEPEVKKEDAKKENPTTPEKK